MKIRLSVPAATALLLLVAACQPATQNRPGESTLQRVQREGVLRVGYANEAPYAYMDTQSGRLTGEAPEIIRAIAADLGVDTVEGVLTEFGALIPGLQANRFDVIAAGMYITPERCRQISFSNPTYTIGEAFIVKKGNPLDLHSYEDVARHASATIGVMAGAVEHGYAKAIGVPTERIVVFPDNVSGLDGVKAGRVDAFAATSLTAQDMLMKANDSGIELAQPFTDPIIDGESIRGYGAFGLRNDDTGLLTAINEALDGYIGSPAHLQLVKPFGFTEANVPDVNTAAELCGR